MKIDGLDDMISDMFSRVGATAPEPGTSAASKWSKGVVSQQLNRLTTAAAAASLIIAVGATAYQTSIPGQMSSPSAAAMDLNVADAQWLGLDDADADSTWDRALAVLQSNGMDPHRILAYAIDNVNNLRNVSARGRGA